MITAAPSPPTHHQQQTTRLITTRRHAVETNSKFKQPNSYRREILHVGSKLNFRSPARQVFIDTTGPDFISWNDINGIDEVKREIEEIIDYLKNPALLRLRGVSRIGGVLLAGAPGTGKTLLAKAIAAESGVRMFTCSGACVCGGWRTGTGLLEGSKRGWLLETQEHALNTHHTRATHALSRATHAPKSHTNHNIHNNNHQQKPSSKTITQ